MTEPGAPQLSIAAIDLSALAECLEQDDWSAGYLDPVTGEIWPPVDGGAPLGPDGKQADPEARGWITVGGEHDPRAAYADMVDFTRTVSDAGVRGRLEADLEGKGAFKRFRDTMYREVDATTGRAWSAYREIRAQVRAIDWLVEQDVVDEDDARQATATLTATLGQVRAKARAPRLIVLNGMPGVGKSTLAARYAAERPDVLLVDADVLAQSLADDPRGPAEASRSLSLSMAKDHLDAGHDVVVPQLIARPDQLVRFVNVARAARANFVHVFVVGEVAPHRVPVAAQRHLKKYRSGIAALRRTDDGATLTSMPDDVEGTYRHLVGLLEPAPVTS